MPYDGDRDGERVSLLRLEFPSANEMVESPLTFFIDPDRILNVSWLLHDSPGMNWSWDWIHYLNGNPHGIDWQSDDSGIRLAVSFLEEFFAEKVVAHWAWDKSSGSSGPVSAPAVVARDFHVGERLTVIRSWQGTLDLTLDESGRSV